MAPVLSLIEIGVGPLGLLFHRNKDQKTILSEYLESLKGFCSVAGSAMGI